MHDAIRRKSQIQVFAYVIPVDHYAALELNCQRMAVYVVRREFSALPIVRRLDTDVSVVGPSRHATFWNLYILRYMEFLVARG